MAALRRRRTEDANESQTPVEEVQATLDFGAQEETVAENEVNLEETKSEETQEQTAASETNEEEHAEAGKVVVKKRRVVKKSEDSENASANEVKSAHRRLAAKYHPDRLIAEKGFVSKEDTDRFNEIQKAYETIVNG